MRTVIVSTCNAVARYIIRQVHAHTEVTHVLKVDLNYGKKASWRERLRPGRLMRGLERRCFYNPMQARQEKALASFLDSKAATSMPPVTPIDPLYLNTKATAQAIKELVPDLLLVCFSPVLKPVIFSLPRLATLNIHFGLAPKYRGEHTLFWPRYHGDWEGLGVTLHHIDRGIDTGAVLAHGFLSNAMGFSEVAIQHAAAQLAAEMTLHTIEHYNFSDSLLPYQLHYGPLYRLRDRRIWHDLKLAMQGGGRKKQEESLSWNTHYYWQQPDTTT